MIVLALIILAVGGLLVWVVFPQQVTRVLRPRAIKLPFILGSLIAVTAGGRHAWYHSNYGRVRKPYFAPAQKS